MLACISSSCVPRTVAHLVYYIVNICIFIGKWWTPIDVLVPLFSLGSLAFYWNLSHHPNLLLSWLWCFIFTLTITIIKNFSHMYAILLYSRLLLQSCRNFVLNTNVWNGSNEVQNMHEQKRQRATKRICKPTKGA